jgi:hypothetical protein
MKIAELLEGTSDIKSNNVGRGYSGEWKNESEGSKKFKAMHTLAKETLGTAKLLADVKEPNVMIRDFLDSAHGRHLADSEKDSENQPLQLKKELINSFKKFKRSYNPADFHSE